MPRWTDRDLPDSPDPSWDPAAGPQSFPGCLLHPQVFVVRVLEWLQAHPEQRRDLEARFGDAAPRPGARGGARLTWTTGRLAAMPTGEILETLAPPGAPLDEEGFRRLAGGHRSALDLAEEGLVRPDDLPEPYDGFFMMLAAIELWRRLLPDRPCVEMLEEELVDGYTERDLGTRATAIDHWERAWELLKRAVPASVDSVEAAEEHLTGRPQDRLLEWCGDLCEALIDAMSEDRSFARRLLAYSTDFLDRFPDTNGGTVLLMRTSVAEAHAMLGDRRRADEAYGAILADDPDDVPTLLLWADSLWRPPAARRGEVRVRDRERAEELYRRGLDIGGPLEGLLRERLDELKRWDEAGYS